MVLAMAAVAAMAAFSNTAQAAHTAAEVHMFFGDPSIGAPGAATFAPGVNPVADALPGETVWFPVFLQNVGGDFAQNTAGYAIDLYTDAGLEGSVGGTSATLEGALNGASAVGASSTALTQSHNETQMPGQLDRTSIHVGMQEQIAGAADVLAPGGAVHVGYMSVTVGAGATDTIPLYMGVGQAGFGLDAAGAITVGFGWDGGAPNAWRFQNSNVDVLGTTAGHISSIEDASIRIVPEPATFGLLSLGLLAIRRRRNA
jgi:hypothetical protein